MQKKSGSKWSFRCRPAEEQMLVGCEARGYKDRNAREPWQNYSQLFYIAMASFKQFFILFFAQYLPF